MAVVAAQVAQDVAVQLGQSRIAQCGSFSHPPLTMMVQQKFSIVIGHLNTYQYYLTYLTSIVFKHKKH
jgi:tetrahydromethanopterin S-methyltransferase subunit E